MVRLRKPRLHLFVSTNQSRAANALQEVRGLQTTKGKASTLFLERRRNHIGRTRIAPHHLKTDVRIVERTQVFPTFLDQRVARNPGVDKEGTVKEQRVWQVVEELHVVPEHFDRQVRLERVNRFGGLYPSVNLTFVLQVVLVVAAQHVHVLRCGYEHLQRRSKHAVQTEESAIDVVAQQDQ